MTRDEAVKIAHDVWMLSGDIDGDRLLLNIDRLKEKIALAVEVHSRQGYEQGVRDTYAILYDWQLTDKDIDITLLNKIIALLKKPEQGGEVGK